MKIDKSEYEYEEALRVEDIKENIKAKIERCKLLQTKYGDKRLLVLDTGKNVFLNHISLRNMVKAFGDDDDFWQGKDVEVTIEASERTQGNKAIVVTALPSS